MICTLYCAGQRQSDKKISRKFKSSHLCSKCIDRIVNNSSSHIFQCWSSSETTSEFFFLYDGRHLQSFNPLKLQHFLTINLKLILISVFIQSKTNGLNKALTFFSFYFLGNSFHLDVHHNVEEKIFIYFRYITTLHICWALHFCGTSTNCSNKQFRAEKR